MKKQLRVPYGKRSSIFMKKIVLNKQGLIVTVRDYQGMAG